MLDAYALQCGVNYLVSRKLVDELERFPWATIGPNYPAPLKVVIAGCGVIEGSAAYAVSAAFPRTLITLAEADHDFGADVRGELFLETYNWFESQA
jgi:hypothetical protein